MSGRTWEWLNVPSPGLSSFFMSAAGLTSIFAVDVNLTSTSVPLVWLSFGAEGETVTSEMSFLLIAGTSDLGVSTENSFSAPSWLFTLDTGSGRSWQTLISSGSLAGSVVGSVEGSSSESEPDAELLSE